MAPPPAIPLLPRVERVEIDGEAGWLKREERLRGRMRLQKGNSNAAYRAERDAMLCYDGQDLPVPRLLEVGKDYFVTADAGPTLRKLMKTASPQDSEMLLCAAARALAELHQSKIAHGRPALKDICWQDGRITFIDWERHRQARNTDRGCAQDVILFFFSAITQLEGGGPAIEAARTAYLSHAPEPIWRLASQRVHQVRGARWLLSPVIALLQSKREFRAINPFFKFFGDSARKGT